MSMRESKQQSQNLTDSQFHQKFQNNTSSFQVQSQQNDEPVNYEKMLETIVQAQISRNRDIDMMVQTLCSHRLTFLMSLIILLELKNHVVLKNKIPFQYNHLNLPKL